LNKKKSEVNFDSQHNNNNDNNDDDNFEKKNVLVDNDNDNNVSDRVEKTIKKKENSDEDEMEYLNDEQKIIEKITKIIEIEKKSFQSINVITPNALNKIEVNIITIICYVLVVCFSPAFKFEVAMENNK
jgi:hypothetical protein